MKHVIVLSAALLAASPALSAGWTQPAGGHYAKAWTRLLMGKAMFTADGDRVDLPDSFTDAAVNLYGEYGLTDRVTLVGFANPYGHASYAGGDATSYVGFLGGGVRLGRPVGPLSLAGEVRYGYAPDVGAKVVGAGEAEGVPFVLAPTVNTHRIEGEVQVGMGLPFGWWAASVGARAFSEAAISPAVIGFAQVGWQVSSAWVLDLHFNLNQPVDDVEITNVLGAGQTAYLGYGLSASWWFLEALGLHVGVEGVAYAKSNASTPTLTLGLETRGR